VVKAMPFIGAFESTYQPAFDVDVLETTGHAASWRRDLELLAASGVSECRYPIRWHRVESTPGRFDWTETDRVLAYLRDRGVHTIADLVHHTSYPAWLGGFVDPRFGPAFVRYVEQFALRYPWIQAYTLFNEPFTTFLLCGQEGIWPPHLTGIEGFVAIARNVLPPLTEASRVCRRLLPEARHVHVEVCERSTGETAAGAAFAEYANDRRFFLTDAFLGLELDRDRPFVADLLAHGGRELLELEPGHIDVLGVDYYAHNQWHWTGAGEGTTSSPEPAPFADLLAEYWARYGLPLVVGETNIRGFPSDRATWLKYTLEQCELARASGVPVQGYCWFPFIDSCDWDSILCRNDSSVDPVGVYWLDGELCRRPSSMSDAYCRAARGTPSSGLPAYELSPMVARRLVGWIPHLAGWDWRPPPPGEVGRSQDERESEIELKVVARGV
jgi:beta-glucosidase/6-phospho-beta-glucosidase/beta-galactosidase